MFLGSRAAAAPYVAASKLFTGLYFAYFLLILPGLARLSETLTAPAVKQATDPTEMYDEEAKLYFYKTILFGVCVIIL